MSVPGRTLVTAKALRHLAALLAGQAAEVPPRRVEAVLSDEDAALRIELTLPVRAALPGSLVERAQLVRWQVAEGMERLASRSVSAVDVRFAGVLRDPGEGRSVI